MSEGERKLVETMEFLSLQKLSTFVYLEELSTFVVVVLYHIFYLIIFRCDYMNYIFFVFEKAKMEFTKITMNPNQHKECQIRSRKVATYKGKQKLYQSHHPTYIKRNLNQRHKLPQKQLLPPTFCSHTTPNSNVKNQHNSQQPLKNNWLL